MKEENFGRQLEYYIRESGYTNYEFARISGVNRVNIQRYLAGTRLPDIHVFEKMQRKLRMGGGEQKDFFESYKRALDGDNIYFLRKKIRDMLEQAGSLYGAEAGCPSQSMDSMEKRNLQIIDGRIAIERYMWTAVNEILKKKARASAYFYIPAGWYALSRLLPAHYIEGKSVLERLHIMQIIQLTKRAEILEYQYHNVQSLYNMISTYYQAGAGYETYFYYNDYLGGRKNDGAMYPYYGILEDRVVLFSEDMDQGIVLTDERVTALYRRRFAEKIEGSAVIPLTEFSKNALDMPEWFLQNDSGAEWRCFLGYQPCVAAWADREMLEAVLVPELSGRELLIEKLIRWREQLEQGELLCYFTEEGLRELVKNGVCADCPPEYVRPLTERERCRFLDRMIADAEEGKKKLGIIDGKYLHLTRMLNVFVSSTGSASLVLYDKRQGLGWLLVREASISQAFELYIRGMRDHREVYSREETIEILKKYRSALTVN